MVVSKCLTWRVGGLGAGVEGGALISSCSEGISGALGGWWHGKHRLTHPLWTITSRSPAQDGVEGGQVACKVGYAPELFGG